MNPVSIVVRGDPATQGSMAAILSRTTGKTFAKHPAKTMQWRKLVAWEAKAAMGSRPLLTGPLRVDALFYLRSPKRPQWELPAVRPDLDKLLRAAFDALSGVVYGDDAQIVSVIARKIYAHSEPFLSLYVAEEDRR